MVNYAFLSLSLFSQGFMLCTNKMFYPGLWEQKDETLPSHCSNIYLIHQVCLMKEILCTKMHF